MTTKINTAFRSITNAPNQSSTIKLNTKQLSTKFAALEDLIKKPVLQNAATTHLPLLTQFTQCNEVLLKSLPLVEAITSQLTTLKQDSTTTNNKGAILAKLMAEIYTNSYSLLQLLYNTTGLYQQFYAKYKEPMAHKEINGHMYMLTTNPAAPKGSIQIPGTNLYWEPVYGAKDLAAATGQQLQEELQADISAFGTGEQGAQSLVRIPTAKYLLELNEINKQHQMCATALIQTFKMGMQMLSTISNQIEN